MEGKKKEKAWLVGWKAKDRTKLKQKKITKGRFWKEKQM